MAKIYGISGALSGKLAGNVMVIRGGDNIVREYKATIANPNTPAQVSARARLKMMSQLAAVMAPAMMFRKRSSNVSMRNVFVKANYPLATYENDQATINLASVKLTEGVVALPNVSLARTDGTLSLGLVATPNLNVNRVVYAVFARQADGTVRLAGTAIATEAGASLTWPATIQAPAENGVVLAYGLRDNTDAARVTYGNIDWSSVQPEVVLDVTRRLLESDVTVTETKGDTFAAAV